jgi:DNA-binding transcriptional ArsR family regulator
MDDNITLDKETFKALAIDTRVNILRKLDERFQLTLSDLAAEFDMAPSTISEHLDKLVSAGLIAQVDKGMKWKYYRLTPKAKKILNPYEKKVWIVLSVAAVTLFAAVYRLLFSLEQLATLPFGRASLPAPTSASGDGGGLLYAAVEKSSERALDEAAATSTTAVGESVNAAAASLPNVPYPELMLVLLLVLVVGVCVGYLIRRKKII